MSNTGSIFLSAEWRNLIFISYLVPDSVLLKYLPNNTILDRFENSAVVSLVAFEFLNTNFAGIKAPFFHSFAELNLRFYVKHKDSNEPAVVFIKEICPYHAVAWTARLFYNEVFLVMPSKLTKKDDSYMYSFGKIDGALNSNKTTFACPHSVELAAKVNSSKPRSENPESINHFLVERYVGYSKWYNKKTLRYNVEHPPWKVETAKITKLQADFETLYGSELALHLSKEPLSVIFTEGSKVNLSKGLKC